MRLLFVYLLTVSVAGCIAGCKKNKEKDAAPEAGLKDCSANRKTIRTISEKTATVIVGATAYGFYLVEDGTIDMKLMPCVLPNEFMQNNLKVIISGDVKESNPVPGGPCCAKYFNITKIRKL